MFDSRLYYDLIETIEGILKFSYYTSEIDYKTSKLTSYTKIINQDELLLPLRNVGHKELLYDINETEFSRFLVEFEEHKNNIEILSRTDVSSANIEFAKMWGSNELQRKFAEWFSKNGYDIPKIITKNKNEPGSTNYSATGHLNSSKMQFEDSFKKWFVSLKSVSLIRYYLTLIDLI